MTTASGPKPGARSGSLAYCHARDMRAETCSRGELGEENRFEESRQSARALSTYDESTSSAVTPCVLAFNSGRRLEHRNHGPH